MAPKRVAPPAESIDRGPWPSSSASPRPKPEPDDRPFWKRKTMREMTQRGMGEPVRRLRPLLPQQAERGGTDKLYYTDVGCRLLDGQTCRCTDYENRAAKVNDCVALTTRNINRINWLPPTCGYKLVAAGKDLYWWHPLVSGDPDTVHAGRRLGARQGVGDREDGAGRQARRAHRELADEMAEGEQGVGRRCDGGFDAIPRYQGIQRRDASQHDAGV